MRAYERFLQYAVIHTTSDDTSGLTPSSQCQFDLARHLVEEMRRLGIPDAHVDGKCYVYGSIPASPGCEDLPALGFCAHLDTASFNGKNVRPRLVPDYDGGDIVLGTSGRVLSPAQFPHLPQLRGKTLIVTDGATLLGADDKAGIAEIMTLCETLIRENLPHGRICVAFTPDEEIGEGADHFDVEGFGARYAYTVDGDLEGGIEYENFNAAGARVDITGVSVHPGSAKDAMENALLIAMEINAQLPPEAIPARTEGYEGFFHLESLTGDPASAQMAYIIRDHDQEKFQEKKALLERAVHAVQSAHPRAALRLEVRDSYYNMAGQLKDCMHLVDNARRAAEMAGLTPAVHPIRGGTDGARLSYMGLPCPNLGTGGFNFHGPYECVSVEGMDGAVAVLKNIVSLYAEQRIDS